MSMYSRDIQHDQLMLLHGSVDSANGSGIYKTALYDHIGLVDFLKEMADNQISSKEAGRVSEQLMRTEVGKRALYLATENVVYDTEAFCCEESEPRLIKALQPEVIQNPATKSPIIFTYHGALAGVLKRFGERTTYGLTDHPDKGLYSKTFHGLTRHKKFIESLPPSDHPWQIALNTPTLQTFDPLRLSTFTVPLDERQLYQPMDFDYLPPDLSIEEMNDTQSYTHEMIYDLTEAARKNAVAVSPV